MTFFVSFNTVLAADMKDGEILQLLDKYSDYLTQGFMVWDFLRPIGLLILSGLAKVLDGLSSTLGELIKLLNFVDNSEFQALLNKVEPLKWGLLLLFLIGFFVLIMFNKVNDAFQAPLNIVLLICMTIMLPFFFSTTSTMVQEVFGDLSTSFDTPGTSIILQNTTDLRAVAEEGWKMKDGETLNHYKKVRQIDMKEKLDDSADIENGEPFGKKIFTNSKGEDKIKDIDKAADLKEYFAKKIFSEYYYRNKVWFFNCGATLIVMIAATAFTTIKFAIIINKLYGDYVLLLTGGLADFMSMQRAKAVFSEIAGTFALIVYIPILFQCYMIGVAIINAQDFSFMTYLVAMIGAAIALIDGPNGFQRVTGIDAGLKSSAGLIATTLGGSKLVNKAVDMTANAAKSAGGLLTDAAAFGLGAAFGGSDSDDEKRKGINDDEPDNEERDENDPRGINEDDSSDTNVNEDEKDGSNPAADENEVKQDTDDDQINEELPDTENQGDGPGPINNQDDDPESNSLYDQEPPSEDTGDNNGINNQNEDGFNNDENESNTTHTPSGINSDPTLNSGPKPNDSNDISQEEEEPKGLNETDLRETEIPQPKREPAVGPTKTDQELHDLNQSNPLKKELKQKAFGYDQNDPRRYTKQTTLERKQSSFEVGREYKEYRRRKKELLDKKNEE